MNSYIPTGALTDPSEAFVSVVTPFYNTEAYLSECIESVLGQTHENLEYILVDNASTDDSFSIATHYAALDNRIRVVQTDRFLTQIENYNFALSQISTESLYCKVVQADDWIYPHCLTEMVGLAIDNPTVGLVLAYSLYGTVLECAGLGIDQVVLTGMEAARLHLQSRLYVFGTPNAVLYRADLVRKRSEFYSTTVPQADTDAAYSLLKESDLGFVHQVLSYSRYDSISTDNLRLRLRPRELNFLIAVKRHGPSFLTSEELGTVERAAISNYYTSVALGWIQNRLRGNTQEFWQFHRRGLRSVGLEIAVTHLPMGFVRAIAQMLLCPARLLRYTSSETARSS